LEFLKDFMVDAGVSRRLHGSCVSIVAEPPEEGSDCIRVAEDLNILGSQFEIMLLDGRLPLCSVGRHYCDRTQSERAASDAAWPG